MEHTYLTLIVLLPITNSKDQYHRGLGVTDQISILLSGRYLPYLNGSVLYSQHTYHTLMVHIKWCNYSKGGGGSTLPHSALCIQNHNAQKLHDVKGRTAQKTMASKEWAIEDIRTPYAYRFKLEPAPSVLSICPSAESRLNAESKLLLAFLRESPSNSVAS